MFERLWIWVLPDGIAFYIIPLIISAIVWSLIEQRIKQKNRDDEDKETGGR